MVYDTPLALITILLILSLSFSVYCVVQLRSMQNAHHSWRLDMEKKMIMTQNSVMAVGNRVLRGEGTLASLHQQEYNFDTKRESNEQYSYTKARTLLDEGMSACAVAESCGLSVAEVELMSRLNFRSDRADLNLS